MKNNKLSVLAINSCNFGSTGNIMLGIAEQARENNIDYITTCPDGRTMRTKKIENHFFIGDIISRNIHLLISKITGLNGCGSIVGTILFLKKVDTINPDIIHLHNLHNSYINLPLLFRYIKKRNIRVVWTLHDCWAFTGHCPHFLISKCNKWIKGCSACKSYKKYPESLMDNSSVMWKLKRSWFTGVKNMIVVTPSSWLKGLVELSFLNEYPIQVINNGVDLDIFTPKESSFRDRYNINGKKIVLGVSFSWGFSKGLDVFVELSQRLPSDYVIILVGTNEEIDKQLPNNIISIHKTSNRKELAEIYSSADVFANPTREDTYPTVNMEAIACGTPVVTFATGGSPEIITDRTGKVVKVDDLDEFINAIKNACENKNEFLFDVLDISSKFDRKIKFQEYIRLYNMDGE